MKDLLTHLPAVLYEYEVPPVGSGRFTFISEASERILGVKASEVLASEAVLEALVHPEDLPALRRSSEWSYQEETELYWTGRMILHGVERWVEIRSNYERQTDGSVVRRGLIQDITERRQSLEESELRYETLVERLPIGIVVHHHGRVVFANAEAHLILGAAKGQLSGSHIFSYVHPDYRDKILQQIRDVSAGANSGMVEQKYLRVDGRVIDIEALAYPFVYNGTPSVQVIFRDISARKQAEAQIRKNETMFSQLFRNLPLAVVLLDENGKVNQVNQGFEQMFGFEMHQLQGKNLNDYIVPDHLQNEGIDLNNLITSNKVVRLDTLRKHRDGKLVNVLLYGVPILHGDDIIGIYGVYVDITDRMKVEEELKIRNAELDNFVYKVSHDLRAPLSSVLGLVNLSKLPGNTDNPADYIHIIGEKVEQLDNFIGDVLSHSKNLKMEITTSRVDFSHIIERTFNDLSYLSGANKIRKSVKVEGVDFYSDPWRISEIMRNLVSNAIKYRNTGGSDSEVLIVVKTDTAKAEITFADNGIGIAEENMSRIFEMFYRATEQSDGSGIGLYIVKNAVDKLGGQISVNSKPRHGTRFNIILPNRIKSTTTKIAPAAAVQK